MKDSFIPKKTRFKCPHCGFLKKRTGKCINCGKHPTEREGNHERNHS